MTSGYKLIFQVEVHSTVVFIFLETCAIINKEKCVLLLFR